MKSIGFAIALLLSLAALTAPGLAKEMTGAKAGPDKAHCQKIWDGWSTLNPDNVSDFYASGAHTFFDIAPLKYSSWDEYKAGVRKELADYKSAKFTVNDDLQLHPIGTHTWGTATVNFEMTHKDGKVEKGDMRWTVVFHKQGDKWLIVHEHVSVPMQ